MLLSVALRQNAWVFPVYFIVWQENDDVTGTMPPYDKHIVYGPHNPSKVAEEITSGTGAFGAAVADVNDLKRSCVLGVSKGVNADEVAQILIDNPFGNGSQKTPVVVIKNYRRAR